MLLQTRHQLDEVAGPEAVVELMDEDVVPGVLAGAWRSRQREQIGAAGDAGDGARLDGRGPDLLEAEPAEQLAEAGDVLLEHVLEGFWRDVAAGDAGAAGRDHDVDVGIGDPGAQPGDDRGAVILDDIAGLDLVAG